MGVCAESVCVNSECVCANSVLCARVGVWVCERCVGLSTSEKCVSYVIG